MDPESNFLQKQGIQLYLDVGANNGATGIRLRCEGYQGRIVSFEPIRSCYDAMVERCAEDPLWDAIHSAVGDRDGTARIGVSENLYSSSLLPATDRLLKIHAPIRYARYEDVPLQRLDTLLPDFETLPGPVHLKIDTQGYEKFVILGAGNCLEQIGSVRMEVAVTEVYEGEMILPEAISMMTDLGFVLIEAWPAWRHPETGEVLHFDLLFRRT